MGIKIGKEIKKVRISNNDIALAKINGVIVFDSLKTNTEAFNITYVNNILKLGDLEDKYDFYYADSSGNMLEDYDKICSTPTYNYFNNFNYVPIEAEKIIAYAKGTTAKKAIGVIPDTLKMPDLGTKMYSFGALSDVHIDGDGTDEGYAAQDFEKALNYYNTKGMAFVGICGDITRESENNELALFKNIVDNVNGIPVYVCRGNHDCRYSLDDWNTYIGKELQYEIIYNTDIFLFLSMNAEDYGDNCLSTMQLDWLEEKLETYKNQRVFLFFHVFSPNTCGNINNIYPWSGLDTTSGNIQRFIELITKYKNLIYFSGHSHLDFRCQKYGANANIFSNGTTCHRVHIPSCSRPRNNDVGTGTSNTYDNNQGSEGYIVDVYKNAILLRGYDFEIDKYLPIANYLLDTTIEVNTNLYNPNTAPTMNWYITSTEIGVWESDHSTYMQIEPNTTYQITKTAGQRFCVGTTVDVPEPGNNIQQYINNDIGESITITTNANVNYLVIYFIDTDLESATVEEIKNSITVKKV